jgi:simple sugar transport system ATP-binding protein
MRAGTVVGSVHTRDTSKEQLAEMMVGRPIETQLPRAPIRAKWCWMCKT